MLGAGCKGPVDDDAAKTLFERKPALRIAVHPVVVRTPGAFRSDPAEAARAASALAGLGFAEIAAVDAPTPEIKAEYRHNEAAMLGESAEALQKLVRATPPAADAVLYAECLMRPNESEVLALHWVVVDRDGRIAAKGLLNSHWPIFKEVKPRTVADCTTMLVEDARERLGG
jgi:hypothetical protein